MNIFVLGFVQNGPLLLVFLLVFFLKPWVFGLYQKRSDLAFQNPVLTE